ncbi:MAG: hypothetical protein AAF570_05240, partial [Bacteroidota bacterium]
MNKSTLWNTYAPSDPIDEKQLGYLMNFLLKHAEQFIAFEKLHHDPVTAGVHVMAHCLEHGLQKHFRATYLRTHKAHTAAPNRDAEWHLKAWRLSDAQMHYFYASKSRRPDPSISHTAAYLDAFYFEKKLEMSSELLNLNQILQEKLPTDFIPDLLAFLDTHPPKAPSVRIRRLVLNILLDPTDTASFRALRDMLPETLTLFEPEKIKGIFAYAQNYCIRRIKAGDTTFQRELFSIYQES